MQGLILAGGRGSRLAADGVETPKALVEVAGRPQIVHLVETFAELGCDTITCMVREGIPTSWSARVSDRELIVRSCRTPSSLHTLAAGLAVAPAGPVFCAMVDTVMPAADWWTVYQAVTVRLAIGSLAVLAVTPFVDDELPVYVSCDAAGFATAISDVAPAGVPLVSGGVYGFSPVARRLAEVAVGSLHRMRAFLKLLVDVQGGAPVSTVEVPRIIDLDHKRDLDAADAWLTARTSR